MAVKFHQGFFKPRNPEKYAGDVTKIVFRSSWEKVAFNWCDINPSIIRWQSEETIVPYLNELDGKLHRYFVDLLIKVKTNSGIETILIEIKPQSQIDRPVPPKKKTKKALANYQQAIDEWIKNAQKWKAATEYAKQRNWKFQLLNEYDLGIAIK